MENPFKKILHNEELPETLKSKVLDDIAMVKLSIDVADLFVVKYPKTMIDLLDPIDITNKTENTKKNKK